MQRKTAESRNLNLAQWNDVIRKTIKTLAPVIIIFAFHAGLLAQRSHSEAKQIRRVFFTYKQAILQQQGHSAVLLVNRATLRYYSRMKALALEGQEKEVRQLSPINKIMVLSLRHRVPVDDLRAMTPEGVFIHAVNQGWIGKNTVLDSDIGHLVIFGNDASAEYVKSGKPTTLKYRFSKEEKKWKIDLTALTPLADQAMRMLIKKEDLDEDTFIISLLEAVSGKKVVPSIWQPPNK